LENQKEFFEEYINKNLQWRFSGLYVDEGLSGTSTKNRKGFLRMVDDAENGKINFIVTKEISRFARNVLDSVYYTRELKKHGVGVFFLNDNINTLDPDSELRLTIMSSIAQEESRRTSERVKFGQRRQMINGTVFGVSILGYHLQDGKLTVNESEAEVVRLIFDLYLNHGMGATLICRELEGRGIPTAFGCSKWAPKTILYILKNSKYMGQLLQRKQITLDYLSHKKTQNTNEDDFVIIENNHEPLVSREIFEAVQAEIIARRNCEPNKATQGNRYPWSGKLICNRCGSKFARKTWNSNKKYFRHVWQCGNQRKNGIEKITEHGLQVGCNCPVAHEEVLIEGLQIALNAVTKNKDKIKEDIKRDLHKALSGKADNTDSIQHIKNKIKKLHMRKSRIVELFADGVLNRADFDMKNEMYDKSLKLLNEELDAVILEDSENMDLQSRLDNIGNAVDRIAEFSEFSEEVCKKVLDRIVVHDREKLDFFLTGNENKPVFIPLPILPSLPAWR
jgi:DNA invertase Pin-like site-specific DNA recombinase